MAEGYTTRRPAPVTDRIAQMRELVRDRVIAIDAERALNITESYRKHLMVPPSIKRPMATYDVCSKMTCRVEDFELIVGNFGDHLSWAPRCGRKRDLNGSTRSSTAADSGCPMTTASTTARTWERDCPSPRRRRTNSSPSAISGRARPSPTTWTPGIPTDTRSGAPSGPPATSPASPSATFPAGTSPRDTPRSSTWATRPSANRRRTGWTPTRGT